MPLRASEFYEVGMSLHPAVRKDVALRLLESVESGEVPGDAQERLQAEVAAAYDRLKADPARAVPAQDVRAGFEAKWSARS